MATYDYKCLECDTVFELTRSMTENVSKTIHKKCGAVCNQIITKAPSFESDFKGSYRAENPKKISW